MEACIATAMIGIAGRKRLWVHAMKGQ